MEYLLIQKEAWESLNNQVEKLLNFSEQLIVDTHHSDTDEWIESSDLAKVLNLNPRTLHSYKERGLIAFSTVSLRMFYKIKDVEELINKRYIGSNNNRIKKTT